MSLHKGRVWVACLTAVLAVASPLRVSAGAPSQEDQHAATTLATRRLAVQQGSTPDRLRVDIAPLLQGAKVLRADLVIKRRSEPSGHDEHARVSVEIIADTGSTSDVAPLALRGPWFDRLDATEAVRAWVAGKPCGGFVVKRSPPLLVEASYLDVFYRGRPETPPPPVRQVTATHRAGQTFVVFEEIDDRSTAEAPSWGELKRQLADIDRDRAVRYRIYRHTAPITPGTLASAELLAEVAPLSGYNVVGRSVDQLMAQHRRRAIDDLDFAKQLARSNYFDTYQPDMDETPVARFAVEAGRRLPPRTGLYVHHADRPGTAYYTVVSVVDGVAATLRLPSAGPIEETVGPGEPVLQGTPELSVFFDYPGERRHYVQWVAPPLAHLPNQSCNWGVFVPRDYEQAEVKRLSVFFHDATQRYLKPPWPHRRDTLLLSPHDGPYRSFGYGHHEALGTLRSFDQGKVRPFFARRVDAMIDWATRAFQAEAATVSCGGAGPWGGTAALQYGLRRPGKIAYVMAEDSPDPDPQQTPDEFSPYGRGDVRKTHRAAMEAVWGKADWHLAAESGRPVWQELNLVDYVRRCGGKTTLPFLSLGSGSQHVTWKQQTELMRAYLDTRNAMMAEFFWGSSHHLHLPVDAQRGEGPFEPRLDRPVLACDTESRGPNPDFFEKYFDTGQRGYGAGGRLNTQPRWDARDAIDQPDRLEVTIFSARRVAYAGNVTCRVTVRNAQRFRPKPGEQLAWSAADPRDPRKTQQGTATVDAHGHIRIEGLSFGEPARLLIRRLAEKGEQP